MVRTIFITFWILPWLGLLGNPVEAQGWSGVLDESLDERHDAEIFQAVVDSMKQWESHKKNSHRTKREASRVCYEEVGCFEDTGPFSYLEMLPSHPKDVGTRFIMYGSRKARSVPMEVAADDINDKASNAIDSDLPTKVIVHGFGSGCDHVWVYEMRSALMSAHDCNIVCVDWSLGSAIPNYVRAAANTRLVGRQLAKFVRSLNVPLEKVHLIGFSLGAHVAGFAGAELANVSRITGLDPAGPLFEAQDSRVRLDETDAAFVDVIHSNGEQLILGGLGSWQPMGDVDFYPNGGRMQTGCSNLFLGAVSDIIWSGSIEGRSLCNHRRAYKLFTDSVSPKCRFPAFPCDTGYDGLLKGDCFPCGVDGADRPCGDMGYYSEASGARGQLYLVTREEEPFCAHQYQVKLFNSRGERPARSYGKLQVTLVGENNFNETFTMTRKDDEELLVGAILQKIVVPHPTVLNLEAIEIKYTAYSGWISSGLVSWSVDKVSVIDSSGKSLSVCTRALTLESGRAVYLPLYPGECNIPLDVENITSTASTSMKSAAMRAELPEPKSGTKPVGGVGPFTREQNYERKDDYATDLELSVSDKDRSQKGLGPFTKDQNIKSSSPEESVQIAFVTKDGEETLSSSETKKSGTSLWSYVDVSDAGSNSLENTEVESGRAFSGSSFVAGSTFETPTKPTDATTSESSIEVREPVLQTAKQETGRSMRLPEITEPLLKPRTTRQNFKNEGFYRAARQDDLQESSSSSEASLISRSFTVQFLPERLAGIFAQAERYARQTLLPLISQYTPSFVGNARQDRVKYFPPLTDIDDERTVSPSDGYVVDAVANAGNTERSNEVDAIGRRSADSNNFEASKNSSRSGKAENLESVTTKRISIGDEAIRKLESFERASIEDDENSGSETSESVSGNRQDDWVPIQTNLSKKISDASRSERNVSKSSKQDNYSGKWMSEDDAAWNPPMEEKETVPDTKIYDWVPMFDEEKKNIAISKSETSTSTDDKTVVKINSMESRAKDGVTESSWTSTSPRIPDVPISPSSSTSNEESSPTTEKPKERERKFIPLVDFENRESSLVATDGKNDPDIADKVFASTVKPTSHIQRIPGPGESRRRSSENSADGRSMIFPYAYEREQDLKTRYIPLMQQDEMGRSNPSMERNR